MLQKGKHAKQSVVCFNRSMGATYKPFIFDMNIMNFNRARHPNGYFKYTTDCLLNDIQLLHFKLR